MEEQQPKEIPPSPITTRTGRPIKRPQYLIEETSRRARGEVGKKDKGRAIPTEEERRSFRELQAEYTDKLDQERKRQTVTQQQKDEYSR